MRLICTALLLLAGCASKPAELVVRDKVYVMSDTAACERIAVKAGGICYTDTGADWSADQKLGE